MDGKNTLDPKESFSGSDWTYPHSNDSKLCRDPRTVVTEELVSYPTYGEHLHTRTHGQIHFFARTSQASFLYPSTPSSTCSCAQNSMTYNSLHSCKTIQRPIILHGDDQTGDFAGGLLNSSIVSILASLLGSRSSMVLHFQCSTAVLWLVPVMKLSIDIDRYRSLPCQLS